MPSSSTITALVMYGKSSLENLENLKCWQESAILSIAEGNGGQIVSGSGNGMSFSLANNKMTNQEWFEVLTFALNKISTKSRGSVSRARFS